MENPEIDQAVATAEQRVDALIRQAMDDHMRSLVRGEKERVRADYAPALASFSGDIDALIPGGLRSYTLLEDHVYGNVSHMRVRLEGDTTADLEWIWSNVDGRYRIVEVRKYAAS